MAVKTKANIKTQLDAVAAAMTLAMADTVTGIATPFKNPKDGVRNIQKLLDIDSAGVVTINTAKWDAMWSGATYNSTTQAIPNGSLSKLILS